MRVLTAITIIFFTFISLTKADDISEFEIEGMSVGDSLLNYFTEKEIKLFINSPNSMAYKDNKYVAVTTHASYDEFSTPPDNDPYADTKDNYDYVGVIFRPEDKKYIIYEISAYLNFPNDFEGCKNKKDEIVSSISSSFNNIEKETETSPHNYDKSGESISYDTWFYFDNGYVSAHCENWSEKLTKENGWDDKLKVRIIDKKFMNFLTNEAYN
tara:strand:+ start:270 stop:908 length:639 start_codon:yes stop_codon:yes gene_type:complete